MPLKRLAALVALALTFPASGADLASPPLKDLDGYFPWEPSPTPEAWAGRRRVVGQQIQASLGLHPWPSRTPLNAVVHGRVEREDYTIEKVYFEAMPGYFVTGSLFRPVGASGKVPAILCPHGHWPDGRFGILGEAELKKEIERGEERFENGGRSRFQSLGVHLARMGCVAFVIDMIGYADSQQLDFDLAHKFAKQRPEMISATPGEWGFYSPQAESHGQSIMGLQTWSNIRALDFLTSLPDVDPHRIGCTGGSGGGTQTMMLGALDPRVAVAVPAVMVSTAMQGGCTCENACGLRIDTGNVEFAAMFAPKPMAMTSAKDWTIELPTKGFPQLKRHWSMLGAPQNVDLFHHPEFGHNYNIVSREQIYGWFNKHFRLGLPTERLKERDHTPLTREQLTVWDAEHPAPAAGPAFEKKLLKWWRDDVTRQMEQDVPTFRQIARPGLATVAFQQDVPVDAEVAVQPVVVWISEKGWEDLSTGGLFGARVDRLRRKGIAVWGTDLTLQGHDRPTPKVANPRESAAYTHGYNRSVFVQRVQEVRNLIKRAAQRPDPNHQVALVALDATSAPIAAVAAALSGPELDYLIIDTCEFRFQQVNDLRDPSFFPGGARYGDLPGMLALGAPRKLFLMGEGGIFGGITQAAYEVAEVPDTVRVSDRRDVDEALNWLLREIQQSAPTPAPEPPRN